MLLNEIQRDAITEIINVGIGKGAALLNEMLSERIELQIPWIEISKLEQVYQRLQYLESQLVSKVDLSFKGDFSGSAELIFPTTEAAKLVGMMSGEENLGELDALKSGTLSEVGNIVLNGVMGTFGNMLQKRIDYQIPNYLEGTLQELRNFYTHREQTVVLLCKADFHIQALSLSGNILLLFNVDSFEALKDSINQLINA